MKFSLMILSFVVAVALAKPVEQKVSVTQDTAGNYKLAVDLNGLRKVEQGNADGSVSGSYSYVDANGVVQNVEYTSGVDGFRVVGSNLPVAPAPVQDTPEVAEARLRHLALLNAPAH